MTLFSYLENHYLAKEGDYFIKMSTNIPIILNLRFYKGSLKDLAEGKFNNKIDEKQVAFYTQFMKIIYENHNERGGVHKCSIPLLAKRLNIPPIEIPRILYEMQTKDYFTYDLVQDSFCIAAYRLKQNIPEISRILLARAKEIERNNIRKLNSIYITARRLSFKSIEYVMRCRKEKKKVEEGNGNRVSNAFSGVDLELAPKMNNLINSYFLTENFKEIEHELAGELGIEEYLPLIRIDNVREKSALE